MSFRCSKQNQSTQYLFVDIDFNQLSHAFLIFDEILD